MLSEPYRLRETTFGRRDAENLLALLPAGRRRVLDELSSRWTSERRPCIWHVNSTDTGGGVAELLRAVGGYALDLGITMRWLVIDAPPEFFGVTKRIDNGISGIAGDGGELAEHEDALFTDGSDRLGRMLARHVRPGDLVVLHDPQTAGLVEHARAAGASVVWRAHNGCDEENAHTTRSWTFLLPHLAGAHSVVTTLDHFAPACIRSRHELLRSITPCIDPLSPKNAFMTRREALSAAADAGIVRSGHPRPSSRRPGDDGPAAVDVVRCGPGPDPGTPLVVQVGRWDRVKDMAGTMAAFVEHTDRALGAHLALVGPEVHGIADDPEADENYRECVQAWRDLAPHDRRRVQLVSLPTDDQQANARLVNAIGRRASVVTQKSRSEGFGLTATEAMWKGKPLVVSGVGGLAHQVRGCGVAVDPDDHRAFGRAVAAFLDDPAARHRAGARARSRVRREFLPDTHIVRELTLLDDLTRAAA